MHGCKPVGMVEMRSSARPRHGRQMNTGQHAAMDKHRLESTTPRILFLADHLGYPGGTVHGVTTYFLQTLPALRRAGLHVAACFLGQEHCAAEQLIANKVEVHFLRSHRLDPRVIGSVRDLAHDGDFNIVHASQMKSSLLARALGRAGNFKVVLHLHDLHLPPLPLLVLSRLVAQGTDFGIGISQATRELGISAYGLQPEHVRVLHPGVDPTPFLAVGGASRTRIRNELGIPIDAPVVGMVARFYPVKGHRAMLDIFARVVQRRPDCWLVLAGDGPLRAPCVDLARSLGVSDRVKFLGNRSDVPDVIAACDVITLTSESEGLGLAAVEANLCGRPVVGFRTGGLPEVLVDQDCGQLVEQGDHARFADALIAALQQPSSDFVIAKRRQLSHVRFALDAHVTELSDFYGAVLCDPSTNQRSH